MLVDVIQGMLRAFDEHGLPRPKRIVVPNVTFDIIASEVAERMIYDEANGGPYLPRPPRMVLDGLEVVDERPR